jgi:hypothetical protein
VYSLTLTGGFRFYYSGEHTKYNSGNTLPGKTFFIMTPNNHVFPWTEQLISMGNINNDYGSLKNDVFDTYYNTNSLTDAGPLIPYDEVRDFGVTPDTSFTPTSFLAVGRDDTKFDTYTPVYHGETTLADLTFTFNPTATTPFTWDISAYLQGFKFPDPYCHPVSFVLTANPTTQSGLDQTTNNDALSIDFAS